MRIWLVSGRRGSRTLWSGDKEGIAFWFCFWVLGWMLVGFVYYYRCVV